ncbi:zinc-finger domain-containing protein [Candidatus Spongiihabitans sp.]|uniref:zinc-finger domain-containing protein n=1 Tax=Candidatus Spongiihabitans sp. TaxID=3101308 RepID=UPI003C7CE2F6
MSENKKPNVPDKFSRAPASLEADTPNVNQRVEVSADDLPLHCPMPGKRLWDSHPKVYLPIEDGGKQTCPYCGTRYILIGEANSPH